MSQTPSRFDICPYEEPFNWFSYVAQVYEGMGRMHRWRRAYSIARAYERRRSNWKTFQKVAEILCIWASDGFETRRVKKEAGEKE